MGVGVSGVVKIEDVFGNKKEYFFEDGIFNYLDKVYEILLD